MIPFRGHNLVIGATGTGKGVLTAAQARAWRRAGGKVFFLGSKPDEYAKFPADFKTMKQERLIEAVKSNKAPQIGYVDCMVIIDEAWAWDWKKRDIGLQMIANAARSYGCEMWVQSQFPTQMAPTVRGNCDNIFAFFLKPSSTKWAVDNFGDAFAECSKLPPGRCIAQRGLEKPFYLTAWYKDKAGHWKGME